SGRSEPAFQTLPLAPHSTASWRICQPGDLQARLGPEYGALGSIAQSIYVRNVSRGNCQIVGPPHLYLFNSRGHLDVTTTPVPARPLCRLNFLLSWPPVPVKP